MQLLQELLDAARAPFTRPVRSLLVLLSYVLGVAALVAASGITQATTGRVVERLASSGTTEIRVERESMGTQPWSNRDPQALLAWESGQRDTAKLEALEGVDGAAQVRAFTVTSNRVTRGDGSEQMGGQLLVVAPRYLELTGRKAASGSTQLLGTSWAGPVAVLGALAAQRLHVAGAAPGVVIRLNGRPVPVAATLEATGAGSKDDVVYLSTSALSFLTDQLEGYTYLRTRPGYAEPVAKIVPLALSPENPAQVHVSTVAQLAELQQGVTSDLARLLGIIGWVILILSSLTAGTTMFLSVQARGSEIALRRSMGASRNAIWRLFTYEGVLIGFAGGGVGTAVGIGLTVLLTRLNGWPLALGLEIVVTGLAVGILAGAVASVLPALHAARRDPAGILRQS